jgi:hypothetical protein
MTSKMDSPGTRIRRLAVHLLATPLRLGLIILAIPAALALIQSTGRLLTGEFPIARGTWAFDIIYIYVRVTQRGFETLSPKHFSELAPPIQGLLVFMPNLVLVLLGLWSLIYLAKTALKH